MKTFAQIIFASSILVAQLSNADENAVQISCLNKQTHEIKAVSASTVPGEEVEHLLKDLRETFATLFNADLTNYSDSAKRVWFYQFTRARQLILELEGGDGEMVDHNLTTCKVSVPSQAVSNVEICAKIIKKEFNRILKSNESVGDFVQGDNGFIDMTLYQRHPNENYCLKGAHVKVSVSNNECSVIDINIDPGNFDCG